MNTDDFASAVRRTSIGLVSLLVLGMTASLRAEDESAAKADAKLEAFFQSYLDETFALRPLEATLLGDHRFDDRLDDVSPEARAEWSALYRKRLAALEAEIPVDELSADGRVSFEILRAELRRSIWLAENTRPFEEDPRTYGNYITDSVFSLLTQSTLPMEKNVANAIARMAEIPRIMTVAQATITRPPRSVL